MNTPQTKRVKIEVTKEDIEKGQRWVCDKCPIAVAINRATGRYTEVFNYEVFIHTEHCGIKEMILPTEARSFVEAFDDKKPVHPFTFEIEI